MTKRALLVQALVVAATIFTATPPAGAADAAFPLGSRIGIVPPPGFTASKHFPGFENPDGAGTIMMMTLPPQLFAEVQGTLSEQAVKAQGITEDKREDLTLPSGNGQLVIGTEEENGQKFRKWMFLALLPEGAAVVSVRIANGKLNSYPDQVIREALTTLTVRSSVPVDEQLELLPFKLADLAGLRPVRALPGTGVFLTEGASDSPNRANSRCW